MGLLACFSYGGIILNFFNKNGIPFEEKILNSHKSNLMILINIGLVVMLFIDKLIIQIVTKQVNKNYYVDSLLVFDIILAVVMTVIAQAIVEKLFIPVDWFKLSYLSILFIILLVVYKAESLKIKHISSNDDILPTKNA